MIAEFKGLGVGPRGKLRSRDYLGYLGIAGPLLPLIALAFQFVKP